MPYTGSSRQEIVNLGIVNINEHNGKKAARNMAANRLQHL